MRKYKFLVVLLLLVSGVFAKQSIVVSNSIGTDRKAEMVVIKLSALKADFQNKSYILKKENGVETAYQIILGKNLEIKNRSTGIVKSFENVQNLLEFIKDNLTKDPSLDIHY